MKRIGPPSGGPILFTKVKSYILHKIFVVLFAHNK